MDTMTQAQIELRFLFYSRERRREAERLGGAVASIIARMFGG